MTKRKILMGSYLAFAIAGLILPWYYNLQFILYSGKSFTLTQYFAEGMATPLAASITVDFFIGTIPVLVWMMVEGKRLKMKYLWFYFVFTFALAFAFTCPLFLFMRERKLIEMEAQSH